MASRDFSGTGWLRFRALAEPKAGAEHWIYLFVNKFKKELCVVPAAAHSRAALLGCSHLRHERKDDLKTGAGGRAGWRQDFLLWRKSKPFIIFSQN